MENSIEQLKNENNLLKNNNEILQNTLNAKNKIIQGLRNDLKSLRVEYNMK